MPTCRNTSTASLTKLLAVVAERIVDGAILHVIKLWLKAPVIEEDKDGTKKNAGGGKTNSKGTPQGGSHFAVAVELLPAST